MSPNYWNQLQLMRLLEFKDWLPLNSNPISHSGPLKPLILMTPVKFRALRSNGPYFTLTESTSISAQSMAIRRNGASNKCRPGQTLCASPSREPPTVKKSLGQKRFK